MGRDDWGYRRGCWRFIVDEHQGPGLPPRSFIARACTAPGVEHPMAEPSLAPVRIAHQC
jgi:hypothetical protein